MTYASVEGIEGVGKSFFLEKVRATSDIVVILDDDVDGEALEVINELRKEDLFFRDVDPVEVFDAFTYVDDLIYEEKVKPALNDGKHVLQDRGADTTCVYAAIELEKRGEGHFRENYNTLMMQRKKLGPVPEKVFLLVDEFTKCIERAEKRNARKYTDDEREYLRKIDDEFRLIAEDNPKRFTVIDVSHDDVVEKIIQILS